jgi:hypothetical protein
MRIFRPRRDDPSTCKCRAVCYPILLTIWYDRSWDTYLDVVIAKMGGFIATIVPYTYYHIRIIKTTMVPTTQSKSSQCSLFLISALVLIK